jgi:membrane fusion protein, multidrug efflux system
MPIDKVIDTDLDGKSPEGIASSGAPANSKTDVNTLFYEQGRLRAEMDRLHQDQRDDHQRSLLHQPAASPAQDSAPAADGKQAKPEEKSSGNGDQERGPAATGGDGKAEETPKDAPDKKPDAKTSDKKNDPPKQPLMTRVRGLRARILGWTREHPLGTVLGIVGFILLIVCAVFLWRYLQSYESTDDAQIDGHVNAISSRIAGTVTSVSIENNQNVSRGQVVVQLDPRDYEVALAQQKGNFLQAQANLEAQSPNVPITQLTQATGVSSTDLDVTSAQAGYLAQQQTTQSALADLTQAESNAVNAANEEKRYRALAEQQEASREQYDQKLADTRAQDAIVKSRTASAAAAGKAVEQREASLRQAITLAAQAKLNAVRQVAVQRATVDARQAALEISKAQLDQAVLNLSYCKIYAPVDGVIGNKTVEIGATVSVGQELFDVTPIDDLWITANFKETQLRKMHPGQSVRISVDTVGKTFDGYIESMPGATGARYSLLPPDNATGNYVKVVQRLPVRIRLKPNQDGAALLRTGMSVEPKVFLK